jgi:hypothetical protein
VAGPTIRMICDRLVTFIPFQSTICINPMLAHQTSGA